MTIYIKNMVCIRCKMFVRSELTQLGLQPTRVELGQAEIVGEITPAQHDQIKSAFSMIGLELLDDTKGILVEKIKQAITDLVYCSEEPLAINLSEYLRDRLHHNYTHLANIFSIAQGYTIERFFIEYKIKRVKELLAHNELNLTEIAYKMHYSSVAHLSSQFKKVTGDTASNYKSAL